MALWTTQRFHTHDGSRQGHYAVEPSDPPKIQKMARAAQESDQPCNPTKESAHPSGTIPQTCPWTSTGFWRRTTNGDHAGPGQRIPLLWMQQGLQDIVASWSVHAFKIHGRVNKWRRLETGQTCKACARHFPSANRLLRHLQFSPQCAATVASLQLWTPTQPGYGSKAVQEEEKQLLLETWRPTTNDTEPICDMDGP